MKISLKYLIRTSIKQQKLHVGINFYHTIIKNKLLTNSREMRNTNIKQADFAKMCACLIYASAIYDEKRAF